MKSDIHPAYHEINIIMTDGTEYKTRSCYGKPGDTIRLDIDPKSHPAWTGQQRIIDTGGQIAKFNKRFAGIGARKEDWVRDRGGDIAVAFRRLWPVRTGPKTTLSGKARPMLGFFRYRGIWGAWWS